MRSANLGLRFVLELCGLAAVGYWGFHLDGSAALKWTFGIGAPVLMIVVWSMLVAPGAQNSLSPTRKMWLGTLVLGVATAALAAAEHPTLAATSFAVVVVNAALMQAWRQ